MTVDEGKAPLIGDLTGAGQIVNSEVANRAYDDALSPVMREVGSITAETLRAFRLFTAPIQLMAAYQDRLADFCERVRNRVPPEQQQEAPAEIARPFMEAFASTSDGSDLMGMFEELMARAIDKREVNKLSPSFPNIIRSLSPLQARLVASLKIAEHLSDDLFRNNENVMVQRVWASFKLEDFGGVAHHLTIAQDLKEKNLVNINYNVPFDKTALYPKITIPPGLVLRRTKYELTMFGRWFANACVGHK